MRWSAPLFAFPFSVGLSVLLVSACGSQGLGTDQGLGTSVGGASSGSATGGHGGSAHAGTGGLATSSSTGGSTGAFHFDSGTDGPIGVCVPRTCVELGVQCGPQGDGCGGVVQCGNCPANQTCGAGGPSKCGGNVNCKKKTCAEWGYDCGPAGDGCGGLLQCGTCAAPQTCGGGTPTMPGVPGVCGGSMGCVPTGCVAAGVTCGPIGDGCGGIVQCGGCSTPQTCGGAGMPGQCGDGLNDAAMSTCVPLTCVQQKIGCGPAGDGCGGQLDCGTCPTPTTCGGGGMPGQCGGNSGCVALTCAMLAVGCGPAGDGCGNQLDCGTCPAPTTCGGGGMSGQCGGFANCVPETCASLGYNCGPAGDGCGGILECGGTCPTGEICGGGGMPGVCGPASGMNPNCTGLCNQQVVCANGGTTTISGTIYAPNQTDPLYDALVYVPNGAAGAPTYGVTAFTAGVHCGQCGSEVTGNPLVQTLTAPDGTFQLQNVPVGANIPLVIQLGRWRRKITIPNVAMCANTQLTAALTSLPSSEPGSATYPPAWYGTAGDPADNIPLIAFSTGAVDGLECVLLKIGIDQSQFSDPAAQGGKGRIRLYMGESAPTGAAGPGAKFSNTTPSATQLWGGATPDINQYDMVFFPCQGQENIESGAAQTNVINYANAGGRIFTTHYSYVWLFNDSPFNGTAAWAVNQNSNNGTATGLINTTFARGQALAQWLQIVGASTTYGQMPINTLREDFNGVVAPSLLWVKLNAAGGGWPMHMTFDTPVGSMPAAQCGRVLFDDFHVENAAYNYNITFPGECPGGAMSAQEKMLEFMIFDLSSCILPSMSMPPTCTATTCAAQGFNCGPAGDGCGNELMCGTCPMGQTCGGGGTPGKCGGMPCTPITCASQGIQCGPAGDGCGALIQCGNCPNGETCGGGGMPGKCGKTVCNKITCTSQGIQCGPAGDGCGGILNCGNCPPGEACGGGGQPGKCGAPDASSCPPLTCTQQMIGCGPAGDGCGGQLDCGPCPPGETCGGGGTPFQCGKISCPPTTCTALNIMCGPAGDGCGGVLQCGPCPPNQTCGGGGVPGQCGSMCNPATCQSLGYTCGPWGDGCGGLLQCGMCTPPDTCGGGGTPGKCGHLGAN